MWVNDGCQSIGNGAFANCKALQKIRIPKNCVLGENNGNPFDEYTEGETRIFYIFSAADNAAAKAFCEAHENYKFVAEKTDGVSP